MKRTIQIEVSEQTAVYLVCKYCATKYPICVYEKPLKVRKCMECDGPFNDSVVASAIDISQASKLMTKLKWDETNGATVILEIEE